MTDIAGFNAWMARSGPPDMVDGEIVMRTMEELWRRYSDLERIKTLGQTVETTTRRGFRKHRCTVVAVREGPDPMNGNKGAWHWISEDARKVHDNTPRWRQERFGYGCILRIDESTCPKMVGMYLSRSDAPLNRSIPGSVALQVSVRRAT
jgi:hypothetical protein